jgi:hypothetical protein
MCNGQNGHRHLGALHILYHQQPTDLDRRFIEIRQWLTADADYGDLIVEQGLLQDDDLLTETMVVPFHYSADQALESLNGSGRKGE